MWLLSLWQQQKLCTDVHALLMLQSTSVLIHIVGTVINTLSKHVTIGDGAHTNREAQWEKGMGMSSGTVMGC